MSDTVINYLDSYCERAGNAALLAEPLNAATNLFFIVAAIAALVVVSHLPNRRFSVVGDFYLLIIALIAIGFGSGAWHIYADHQTVLMDVIPITLFINIYLVAALRRLFGLGWLKVVGLWLLYTLVGVGAQIVLPPDTLNGTIMYIPTYLTLVLLTAGLWNRDKTTAKTFISILLLWTLSLVFRTIDRDICTQFPWGTHFLWHTLNALVLYRLLRVLIRTAK